MVEWVAVPCKEHFLHYIQNSGCCNFIKVCKYLCFQWRFFSSAIRKFDVCLLLRVTGHRVKYLLCSSCSLTIRSHSILLETNTFHIPQTLNVYFLPVDRSQARATPQSEQLSHVKSPCPRVQQALEQVDADAVGHQTSTFFFFFFSLLLLHYKLSLRCEHCIFYVHHSSLAH